MYGRPAPKLAGRGIKGWIYNHFFRSLLEMEYIYYQISLGNAIKGAETLEYRVKYFDEKGTNRTYHPDFVINENIIVEVKPHSLVSRNKEKIAAAKLMYGDRYIVETDKSFPFLINIIKAKELIISKDLIISDIDKNRFENAMKSIKYKGKLIC